MADAEGKRGPLQEKEIRENEAENTDDKRGEQDQSFVLALGDKTNDTGSLQDAFLKYKRLRQKEIKTCKKIKRREIPNETRLRALADPDRMLDLRMKFLEQSKKYFGVPYSRKYWKPEDPDYNSHLFLDCCGLVRRVMRDLRFDFGFQLGPWNQCYMYDTLPITLEEKDMKPGDLVFISAIYYSPKSKKQKHNLTHVEIWLGDGPKTIGARWGRGHVQVFDSYRFKPQAYHSEEYHFKSIDTWLMGICRSHCPMHDWRMRGERFKPCKKSIFSLPKKKKGKKVATPSPEEEEQEGESAGDENFEEENVPTADKTQTLGPTTDSALVPTKEDERVDTDSTDAGPSDVTNALVRSESQDDVIAVSDSEDDDATVDTAGTAVSLRAGAEDDSSAVSLRANARDDTVGSAASPRDGIEDDVDTDSKLLDDSLKLEADKSKDAVGLGDGSDTDTDDKPEEDESPVAEGDLETDSDTEGESGEEEDEESADITPGRPDGDPATGIKTPNRPKTCPGTWLSSSRKQPEGNRDFAVRGERLLLHSRSEDYFANLCSGLPPPSKNSRETSFNALTEDELNRVTVVRRPASVPSNVRLGVEPSDRLTLTKQTLLKDCIPEDDVGEVAKKKEKEEDQLVAEAVSAISLEHSKETFLTRDLVCEPASDEGIVPIEVPPLDLAFDLDSDSGDDKENTEAPDGAENEEGAPHDADGKEKDKSGSKGVDSDK